MPRIDPIDPARAEGKAATLLAGVQKSLGMTPNLMSTLAVSPTALEAYLGLMKALGGGRLGGRLGEQLSLAISNANGCGYCTSVHTALGRHLGVEADELARNQRGRSADPKVEAALQFALALVAERRGNRGRLPARRCRRRRSTTRRLRRPVRSRTGKEK